MKSIWVIVVLSVVEIARAWREDSIFSYLTVGIFLVSLSAGISLLTKGTSSVSGAKE